MNVSVQIDRPNDSDLWERLETKAHNFDVSVVHGISTITLSGEWDDVVIVMEDVFDV